jgi:hypothetical protein
MKTLMLFAAVMLFGYTAHCQSADSVIQDSVSTALEIINETSVEQNTRIADIEHDIKNLDPQDTVEFTYVLADSAQKPSNTRRGISPDSIALDTIIRIFTGTQKALLEDFLIDTFLAVEPTKFQVRLNRHLWDEDTPGPAFRHRSNGLTTQQLLDSLIALGKLCPKTRMHDKKFIQEVEEAQYESNSVSKILFPNIERWRQSDDFIRFREAMIMTMIETINNGCDLQTQ